MSSSVIVALDFESQAEALALVESLGEDADFYKVGLQLLTEAGPEIVKELVSKGKHVFLDLKIHEIPNSVAGAVAAAGRLGATAIEGCGTSAGVRYGSVFIPRRQRVKSYPPLEP